VRLAKYLAHAGVASRRAAVGIIAAGRVSVAGEVVRDPAFDVGEDASVQLDGRPLGGPEPRVAYAVHKPLGVVSTARDTRGRRTVVDLVPDAGVRLYPVGRLDADSSGLIVLTNDGALAQRLTHPSFEVPRTYRVTVGGPPLGARALRLLREGVALQDGLTAPAQVRRLGAHELELTLREGRNRQVRRMCAMVGHPVSGLERTAFGPLRLERLRPGASRRLTAPELQALREL
jgi:23S rRNA pseudouridine2605 synthase